MKLITALILLCTAATAMANPFPTGSAIFTRADRKVHSPPEMLAQFKLCSANIGVNLTAQEEQHLGAYLNQYYKFK